MKASNREAFQVQVPPAATHAQFGPWEAVGLDVSEWTIPGKTTKLKFLLMIDMATRLRAVQPLLEAYDITTIKHENAEKIIQAFSAGWLGAYPKPHHIIADNGKSFTSSQFGDFCREDGIELSFPAEKEAWAHGLVEKAIKDLKFTASAIQVDNMVQKPEVTLQLAASALNSTEHVSGYTSHQWAFGRDYNINEEDRRAFAQLGDRETFATLVAAQQRAEEVANKTRSQRILVRLGNSKARQPLRSFEIADSSSLRCFLTKIKMILGATLCGSCCMASFSVAVSILYDQSLLLRRCITRSTARRTSPNGSLCLTFFLDESFKTSLMKFLRQINLNFLIYHPDRMTLRSSQQEGPWSRRHSLRRTGRPFIGQHLLDLEVRARQRLKVLDLDLHHLDLMRRAQGHTNLKPTNSPDGEEVSSQRPMVNDYDDQTSSVPHPDQPESKRPRNMDRDIGNHWIEQLQVDAQQEAETLDIFSAFQQSEECLSISFDLHVESHRQKKALERNPVLYLTKKMNGAEVQLQRLSSQEKALFHRAKMKEVDSFLKNQAVRKCLDDQELRRAVGSGRIIKARWVLTWKLTPPDEFEQAQKEAKTDPNTVLTFDGGKKA